MRSPEPRTGNRGGLGVDPGAPGALAGGEPGAELRPPCPLSPPQRPGLPSPPAWVPRGARAEALRPQGGASGPAGGEPTFHGRVGVRAVGKHHVHVLELQPLQRGLQTWGAAEGRSQTAWAAARA